MNVMRDRWSACWSFLLLVALAACGDAEQPPQAPQASAPTEEQSPIPPTEPAEPASDVKREHPVVREESRRRLTCSRNLADLGKFYVIWRMENPGKPKYSGTALFLYFRKKREIKRGSEETLLCPGDLHVVFPKTDEDRKRWDEVDLSNIPDDMCSYAVRDFERYPIDLNATTVQIIACDRMGTNGRTSHHRGGLNVLFDNASAKFLNREALGLAPDEPIMVGPDSPHPMLKKVVYVPAR